MVTLMGQWNYAGENKLPSSGNDEQKSINNAIPGQLEEYDAQMEPCLSDNPE